MQPWLRRCNPGCIDSLACSTTAAENDSASFNFFPPLGFYGLAGIVASPPAHRMIQGRKDWGLLSFVDVWLRCDETVHQEGEKAVEDEAPSGVPSASMTSFNGDDYTLRLQAFLEIAIGQKRIAEALALRRSRPDRRRHRLLLHYGPWGSGDLASFKGQRER